MNVNGLYQMIFDGDDVADWALVNEPSRAAVDRILSTARSGPLGTGDAEILLAVMAFPAAEDALGLDLDEIEAPPHRMGLKLDSSEAQTAIDAILCSSLALLYVNDDIWHSAVAKVARFHGATAGARQSSSRVPDGFELVLMLDLPQFKPGRYSVDASGDLYRGPAGVPKKMYMLERTLVEKSIVQIEDGYRYMVSDAGDIVRTRMLE